MNYFVTIAGLFIQHTLQSAFPAYSPAPSSLLSMKQAWPQILGNSVAEVKLQTNNHDTVIYKMLLRPRKERNLQQFGRFPRGTDVLVYLENVLEGK